MKKNIKMKVNNNNNKKPIELILYDDAPTNIESMLGMS